MLFRSVFKVFFYSAQTVYSFESLPLLHQFVLFVIDCSQWLFKFILETVLIQKCCCVSRFVIIGVNVIVYTLYM